MNRNHLALFALVLILGIAGLASIAAASQAQGTPQTIHLVAGWNLVGWTNPAEDIGDAHGNATGVTRVVWGSMRRRSPGMHTSHPRRVCPAPTTWCSSRRRMATSST